LELWENGNRVKSDTRAFIGRDGNGHHDDDRSVIDNYHDDANFHNVNESDDDNNLDHLHDVNDLDHVDHHNDLGPARSLRLKARTSDQACVRFERLSV
jgi:hypothetical protein